MAEEAIVEVAPERNAEFAAGLLEAGECVAPTATIFAASTSADSTTLHILADVALAEVVMQREVAAFLDMEGEALPIRAASSFVFFAENRSISRPRKSQRIYALDVLDRDTFHLQSRDPKGQLTKKSLSFPDLFSFDVVHAKRAKRSNLEARFHRYEQDVTAHSQALLLHTDCTRVTHSGFRVMVSPGAIPWYALRRAGTCEEFRHSRAGPHSG